MAGAQTIALAPLSDSETAGLVSELLGPDPSNGALSQKIARRATGDPFFAEEIVRELAERGVLRGEPGAYLSGSEVGDVSVPVTLQAAIAARIDRLAPMAKRTLSAAAVLGARFNVDMLAAVGVEAVVDDLLAAQLIDQVRFAGQPAYVFHHPSIRTVAYELQLESDRAELHRRAAAAIESRNPAAGDENAALIAEHLEAAGDGHAAYGWQVRAATWATATSQRHGAVGSAPGQSPTPYPPMTPTGHPCASLPAPCCAESPGELMSMRQAPVLRNYGSYAPLPGTSLHWPSPWRGR